MTVQEFFNKVDKYIKISDDSLIKVAKVVGFGEGKGPSDKHIFLEDSVVWFRDEENDPGEVSFYKSDLLWSDELYDDAIQFITEAEYCENVKRVLSNFYTNSGEMKSVLFTHSK